MGTTAQPKSSAKSARGRAGRTSPTQGTTTEEALASAVVEVPARKKSGAPNKDRTVIEVCDTCRRVVVEIASSPKGAGLLVNGLGMPQNAASRLPLNAGQVMRLGMLISKGIGEADGRTTLYAAIRAGSDSEAGEPTYELILSGSLITGRASGPGDVIYPNVFEKRAAYLVARLGIPVLG